MRIADVDFILVPEWLARPTAGKPDDDLWISRWQRNIVTARWLEDRGPSAENALVTQAGALSRPTIVVTHGNAVDVLLGAGEALAATPVVGAFITAPVPDLARLDTPPAPSTALAFPSVVIAPDDHPDCSIATAKILAELVGGDYVSAGAAGRIDSSSGQGPWPDGLLRLGRFLKELAVH